MLPDYHAVLDSGIDAVFVCKPNPLIPDVVVAALDSGKHVFCEKPPGIERIMEAERRNPGGVLKAGQESLSLPHHRGEEDRRHAKYG